MRVHCDNPSLMTRKEKKNVKALPGPKRSKWAPASRWLSKEANALHIFPMPSEPHHVLPIEYRPSQERNTCPHVPQRKAPILSIKVLNFWSSELKEYEQLIGEDVTKEQLVKGTWVECSNSRVDDFFWALHTLLCQDEKKANAFDPKAAFMDPREAKDADYSVMMMDKLLGCFGIGTRKKSHLDYLYVFLSSHVHLFPLLFFFVYCLLCVHYIYNIYIYLYITCCVFDCLTPFLTACVWFFFFVVLFYRLQHKCYILLGAECYARAKVDRAVCDTSEQSEQFFISCKEVHFIIKH